MFSPFLSIIITSVAATVTYPPFNEYYQLNVVVGPTQGFIRHSVTHSCLSYKITEIFLFLQIVPTLQTRRGLFVKLLSLQRSLILTIIYNILYY